MQGKMYVMDKVYTDTIITKRERVYLPGEG